MVNPCSMCTALCCKTYLITVTGFDVLRIMEKTGKKPEEFTALVPAKILNLDNESVLECYDSDDKGLCKNRYEYLLTLKSHPCYFLSKDNLCTIHDAAPAGCQLYPFNNAGQITPRGLCPTIPKFLFRLQNPSVKAKTYVTQMLRYRKIVAKWNKMHGKKEDCLSFILKESKKVKNDNV